MKSRAPKGYGPAEIDPKKGLEIRISKVGAGCFGGKEIGLSESILRTLKAK